jgi:hypothetical protein
LFQERPPLIVCLGGLSTIAGTWLVSYERAGETKWRAVDLLFPLSAAVPAHADQHHAAFRHRSYRPVLARRRENYRFVLIGVVLLVAGIALITGR